MCSHILSDIEVLCDRVAIMRAGKLAETGRLEDLRRGDREKQQIEITVVGTDADAISSRIPPSLKASVSTTAGGARIQVADERDVDAAIVALREAGGRLVSVQPVKQSLEELFIGDGSGTEKGEEGIR
jgi:ABC-2 type transport system ATP-binding protein